MFDFWKFYRGLLNRTDYFDDYWDKFPKGKLRFKDETLSLLQSSMDAHDAKGLSNTLAVINNDGADKSYTDMLLKLLDEKWHTEHEEVVTALELIKDPKSVDKLYETAVDVPADDDMRALAKKCMWALSTINTEEAIAKLKLLQASEDWIIKENATFQLEQVVNKK